MVILENCLSYEYDLNEYKKSFKKIYQKTIKLLGEEHVRDVYVNIVEPAEIKNINKKYRNKNKVTDVISFAFDETQASVIVLGEIYICLSQAIKQAKEFNHSLHREMCFLFVHGLLHLYGFDHLNEKDEQIMFKLQEKILEQCRIYRE